MRIIGIVLVLLLCATLVAATESHEQEIAEGKSLVESKASCDTLSNDQLEVIGEYYMEQMHRGESHELMNRMMASMMGEQGEEQMHVQMAKVLYCGEKVDGMMGGGMMGMMQMMNMMGGGNMMGSGGMMGGGMMSPWGASWSMGSVLGTILLIGLVILVWLWIAKLWRELSRRR